MGCVVVIDIELCLFAAVCCLLAQFRGLGLGLEGTNTGEGSEEVDICIHYLEHKTGQ